MFAVLVAWYNGLRMDQNIVNKGILEYNDKDAQVISETMKPFSFWEVFKIKYCACCLSKGKKKERKNQKQASQMLFLIQKMKTNRMKKLTN